MTSPMPFRPSTDAPMVLAPLIDERTKRPGDIFCFHLLMKGQSPCNV